MDNGNGDCSKSNLPVGEITICTKYKPAEVLSCRGKGSRGRLITFVYSDNDVGESTGNFERRFLEGFTDKIKNGD